MPAYILILNTFECLDGRGKLFFRH